MLVAGKHSLENYKQKKKNLNILLLLTLTLPLHVWQARIPLLFLVWSHLFFSWGESGFIFLIKTAAGI